MDVPLTKVLGITRKFRAPAALFIPSDVPGGGWVEVSGKGAGGEVTINLQEDANEKNSKKIPVVRFTEGCKTDVVNGRILEDLPIIRKHQKAVLFKSAFSNTTGNRKKTMIQLLFESSEDTDDFVMWWCQMNGSIKRLLDGNKRKMRSKKRKDCNFTGSGFTPKKKKQNSKQDSPIPIKRAATKVQSKHQPKIKEALADSTNKKNVVECFDKEKKLNRQEEEQEVTIDYQECAASQDWMSAFL